MTDTTTVEDPTPVPATPAPPIAPEAAEPVPFWNRPLVERFLVPLVLPVVVIVGLVAYVLNISRLFLSGHGHIPVIVGSIITAMILLGATLLSAGASRLRQPAITLVSAAFILSIMSMGWLVLGSSQPKETGPTSLAADLKTKQTIKVTAAPGGALKFAPSAITAKTGLATIEVSVAANGHTFALQDATTLFATITLGGSGSVDKGVAFFEKPGTYVFFCTVPGHEAAGMKGEITVTGPPMTLSAAVTAGGNPPGAAG